MRGYEIAAQAVGCGGEVTPTFPISGVEENREEVFAENDMKRMFAQLDTPYEAVAAVVDYAKGNSRRQCVFLTSCLTHCHPSYRVPWKCCLAPPRHQLRECTTVQGNKMSRRLLRQR